jgi:hypothetical protein
MIPSHITYGAANNGKRGESPRQLEALRKTIDVFVETNGPTGVFIVNDFDEELTRYAANEARRYCKERHLPHIDIKELPGDMTRIRLPKTDTADLKNPHPKVFNNTYKGRWPLQRLANKSRGGLEIHTAYFFTVEDLKKKGIVLKDLGQTDWYISTDSSMIGKEWKGMHPVRKYLATQV